MELKKIKINKNKKGAMGESVLTIYRLVLVTIIGFFVLGVTAVAYGYYLDVKTKEASILVDKIYDCVVDEGVIYLDDLEGYPLFKECFGADSGDVYVRLSFFDIYDEDNNEKRVDLKSEKAFFDYGDSGLEWIKSLFDSKGEIDTKNIQKYRPGRAFESFYANVNVNGETKLILVKLEVFTRYD